MIALMAPAGNERTVYSAFKAGADAVYFGVKGWSRRTSEFELEEESLKRCLEYASSNGKDIRLTINIFYKQDEIRTLLEKLENYVEWGLKEVIMVDIGAIAAVNKKYPELRITASVGTVVTNIESVKFYKDIGVSEVVLPVSTSIADMEKIKKEVDIDLEVFVHGHFDYNKCGHCWMSSYFNQKRITDSGGKERYIGSVNRGGCCFRLCQVPWKLCDASGDVRNVGSLEKHQFHYYSVEDVKKYIGMGISTLKIKGRTYSEDFVVAITGFYRELLDEADRAGKDFEPAEKYSSMARTIEDNRVKQFDKRTERLLCDSEKCATKGGQS